MKNFEERDLLGEEERQAKNNNKLLEGLFDLDGRLGGLAMMEEDKKDAQNDENDRKRRL